MEEDKTPIINRTINCPSCGKGSDQKYLPEDSYYITKYDADTRPVEYSWHNPKFDLIRPHYHTLFYCPVCYYVDIFDDYMSGGSFYAKQRGTLKRIQQLIKIKQQQMDDVYTTLGSDIDLEHMTFNTALNIHLLAVYIHELPEYEIRDYNKLANLYLKTAWLYRESHEVNYHIITGKHHVQFSNIFGNYYKAYKDLIYNFNYYRYHIKEAMSTSELETDFSDKYYEGLYQLEEAINNVTGVTANILNLQEFGLSEFKLETQEICENEPYKSYDSMKGFLEEAHFYWPYLPIAENVCLDKACEYFLKDAELTNTFVNKQKNIKLVIRILTRLDRYAEAVEIGKMYIEQLHEFTDLCERRLKRLKNKENSPEAQEIYSHLHSSRIDEEKITEEIIRLKKMLNKKYLSIANSIVKSYPNADLREYLKHFIAAGIEEAGAKKFVKHIENNRKMVEVNKQEEENK